MQAATDEARLITLCAGTEAARAASAGEARRLLERIDWALLADQLEARRLISLLGERILAAADGRAPPAFSAAAAAATDYGARQATVLELISIHLLDGLTRAGIRAMPIKGPSLGKRLYGASGRRLSNDIDVLVMPGDLPAAAQVAASLGYRPLAGTDLRTLPLLHHRFVHAQPELPVLELHWRLHWYESSFSRDLLDRGVTGDELGALPAPPDDLASLLLFYARDGFVDLKYACDLAAWWDRFGSELGPAGLEPTIVRYPSLERVLVAATAVAERVVGLPSRRLLAGGRRLSPRARLAARLANPHAHGSKQQQAADTWLIDWLLTPRGGRRDCIRRQLKAPVGHGARLLSRYAFSVSRIAGASHS